MASSRCFRGVQMALNRKIVRQNLTVEEAASYLGVSRQWLDRDRAAFNKFGSDLKIPFSKISTRKVIYRKHDLDDYLNATREV